MNDFQNWRGWSPWEKVDPALKRSYEGPKAGTGAIYAWQGNKDVGEGRMTITESRPGELVRIKLEFFKPFAATNTAVFSFKPAGDSTAVTWTMTGPQPFAVKVMGTLFNMDDLVGKDFEAGGFDVLAHRPVVSRRDKARLVLGALRTPPSTRPVRDAYAYCGEVVRRSASLPAYSPSASPISQVRGARMTGQVSGSTQWVGQIQSAYET